MANKPYKLIAANQTDFETHFTVVCYDDDQAVAAGQVCRSTNPALSMVGVHMQTLHFQKAAGHRVGTIHRHVADPAGPSCSGVLQQPNALMHLLLPGFVCIRK